jgi:hypothetical protein
MILVIAFDNIFPWQLTERIIFCMLTCRQDFSGSA